MARYAEWNKFIGNLKTDKYGATNVNEVGIAFDKAIADVAPKSEVERWRRNLEAVLEEIPETKREIAREIFEEIDEARERWEAVYSNDHFGYGGGAYGYLQTDVDHTIYELKKKYVEGEQ